MKSQYLASVIIPVHNTAQYLRRCIESVRNQTLSNIEIILVDNLSVDDSPFICDEYAQKDARIKVLHLNEAGLSIARNAGIEIATAPYIGFIDSDDYIEPTMYEDMLSAMKEYNIGVAYCNFCFEYEDGRIEHIYSDTNQIYIRSNRDVQRDIIFEKVSSSSCTKIFDRRFFESHRFPVGMFFEDHATIYRWIDAYDKILWIDRSYYHYLQRGDSICHTIDSLKRYHYFLAEYERLEFVETNSIFGMDQLFKARNFIIRNCILHLNEYIKEGGIIRAFSSQVVEMRKKMKKWLRYSKSDLTKKNYKRIKKISYFWLLYYITHRS